MPKEKVNYQEVYDLYQLCSETKDLKEFCSEYIRLKCGGSDGPRQ